MELQCVPQLCMRSQSVGIRSLLPLCTIQWKITATVPTSVCATLYSVASVTGNPEVTFNTVIYFLKPHGHLPLVI